uniref:Polygalacturonase n=1 Tax=Ananas comosus var. bracteatus TaxID=296719 RepID=A0A6V7NWD4_ANACO|nr:unnamed protein product [Ananas comosus var. bracteatus]
MLKAPNTDGIHISDSTNIAIQNCRIGTGDDCISIVNGSSTIKMKNIDCGPGHGIRELGKGQHNSNSDRRRLGHCNTYRDFKWPKNQDLAGGSGYVKSVRFENVKMNDVENPIIIDQFYCDSVTRCKNQTSAVKISQVMYKNISGTSRSPSAMKFACSDTVPCSNIVLNNINLETENGNAGNILQLLFENTACDGSRDYKQKETHKILHTEL